jgi:hypothetical protein
MQPALSKSCTRPLLSSDGPNFEGLPVSARSGGHPPEVIVFLVRAEAKEWLVSAT